ncbi:MAG: PorP/SprF family type IX secretion system membrane protein [Crocinitomicaceae bacterium]
MLSKINLFKTGFSLTISLLCYSGASFGQDPVFTQFYANPIYLNPALAGAENCPRFVMNHRNQWPSVSGAYVTNSFSYDQYIDAIDGGIAVMVTNDMAGGNTLNWSTLNLAYSYHWKLSRKFSVLAGVQTTWNQKFVNWGVLSFGDQIDPRRGFIYTSGDFKRGNEVGDNWTTRGFFDLSAGLVGYSDKFYFGFAAKHINRPDESLLLNSARMPIMFTIHAGTDIKFGDDANFDRKAALSPNILYTYQNGFMQLNLGLYYKYSIFTLGAWWREGDSFILTTGVKLDRMTFGYSYDITTSPLTNSSGGSHELSLGYILNCKKKTKRFRTLSCPSF